MLLSKVSRSHTGNYHSNRIWTIDEDIDTIRYSCLWHTWHSVDRGSLNREVIILRNKLKLGSIKMNNTGLERFLNTVDLATGILPTWPQEYYQPTKGKVK